MNKVLGVIAVIAFAGITANAAPDGAGYSTKAALLAKQAPTAKVEAIALTGVHMCAKCSVPVKVNEQVSTKPGRGTVQATVFVDQCPGCGSKMTAELKQTVYIHTCTHHCCGA
jgi:hypothetical protein